MQPEALWMEDARLPGNLQPHDLLKPEPKALLPIPLSAQCTPCLRNIQTWAAFQIKCSSALPKYGIMLNPEHIAHKGTAINPCSQKGMAAVCQ